MAQNLVELAGGVGDLTKESTDTVREAEAVIVDFDAYVGIINLLIINHLEDRHMF
jgi:hypothetical protein